MINRAKTGYVVELDNGARYLVKYSDVTPRDLDLDALMPSGVATYGDLVIEQVWQGNMGVRCLNGARW